MRSRAARITRVTSARVSMPGSLTSGSLRSGYAGRSTALTLYAGRKSRSSTKQTGNLRAVQILLGHTKIETMVRYLGVEVEDALALAEGTEI